MVCNITSRSSFEIKLRVKSMTHKVETMMILIHQDISSD